MPRGRGTRAIPNQRLIVYPDAEEGIDEVLGGARRARLEALGRVAVHHGRPSTPADFLARVAEADALLLGWGLPPEVMRQARRLEVVSFIGMGVSNFVDLEEAARLGITVTNTLSADLSVAEHTMAMMLAAARHLPRYDRELRGGLWDASRQGMDLRGKTLGMIGFGRIAEATAPLAKAFGMRLLAWTRNPSAARGAAHGVTFTTLEELLAESDVLSLHLALTPDTRGLLGAAELGRCKAGVILVNTARAELVDEAVLLDYLRSGRIGAAGLDVFTEEPLPPGHPLTKLENVVLTPHSAYNTPAGSQAILDMAIANLEAFYGGAPTNVVAGPGG